MMTTKPLPFTSVKIKDGFWAQRIAANRECGLDAIYQQLESTGRLAAYDLNWKLGGDLPEPHVFWDSDIAKWLEGACYSLMTHPDHSLRARVDYVVDKVISAQGEDGYLNPHFTVVNPETRLSNLREKHELYCVGHLIEAAVAHHRATHDPRFLNAIRKYTDLIERTFGPNPDQIHGYPGHEEIELALVKLYRHTGEERYLNLARYFIDERGSSPHFFDLEAQKRGDDPANYWAKTHAYTQSHKPVREQDEVTGHAVRAMYLYCGMADLGAELSDDTLTNALKILWQDLTAHKLYITGGIGPSEANEGFTTRYDLPNQDAYAETCAAIGLIFWAHRMLDVDLDSSYADVMERALYNGMLSGVSLSGDRYFYVNPLSSDGTHHRQTFYSCACCPPNVNRLLPTIGEYLYSAGENEIITHLYVQSEADFTLKSGAVTLTQDTNYPWDGVVHIRCKMETPITFTLKCRKPGWCSEYSLYLNDENITNESSPNRGYIALSREWQSGDELRLEWAMPVERIYAYPDVQADINRVALMRGPLVYCFEAIDQSVPVKYLRLPRNMTFDTQYEPALLDGVVTIQGSARAADAADWGSSLYQPKAPTLQSASIKAVPYFAWDNRQAGEMQVWMPEVMDGG